MSEGGESIHLEVDRAAAGARGFWRLLVAVTAALPALLWQSDWRLLWQTDRASTIAFGALQAAFIVCAIVSAATALRWFLVVFWIGPLEMRLAPGGISMRLGPFGRRDCRWQDIKIDMAEGVDPELVEQLPDDSFFPRLIDARSGEDLAGTILRFGALDSESLTGVLRPFLREVGKNARVAGTSE